MLAPGDGRLREAGRFGAQPRAVGERLLTALDRALALAGRLPRRALDERFDPLAQAGRIANTSFVIATLSGALLFFWYVPSVHQAYASVAGMADSPLLAELMRSIHRYSSDACMLFAVLHGLQSLAGKRFAGPRWLPWVTGILMVGLVWGLGWTGYWLVWDQRAQLTAVGTARLLDALPIFVDPLGRSLLTDDSVSSLLFFLVFFLHMLVPLAMAVGIWLHIARIQRSEYFTSRALTLWILVALVALSLIRPATSAPPAAMQVAPSAMTLDYWFLLPIVLTDRLESGILWALFLGTGAVLAAIPWWMARGKIRPAEVVEARCNACQACFVDCPYGAIQMVPRTDGNTERTARAEVDPSRCIGCGICNGSCDSAGIGVPWIGELVERRRLERWLEASKAAGEEVSIAYACAESAAADLEVDAETGLCAELPGYRVMPVPCAGWVLAHTAERALRHGARGVLVIGCSPGRCAYREGAKWASQRLLGERKPALRVDKVEVGRIQLLALDRGDRRALVRAAAELRAPERPATHRISRGMRGAIAAATLLLLLGAIWAPSDLPYRAPAQPEPRLVVSFKHAGRSDQHCRKVSPEELAQLPLHMRKPEICDRLRAPVRMKVRIDGEERLAETYPPRGLFGDGNSLTIQHFTLTPGEHRVEVAIGDTLDPNEWSHTEARSLHFEPERTRVVLFDTALGFRWR